MQRKKIEKAYIKKINELKKHDKAYFEHDSPTISDAVPNPLQSGMSLTPQAGCLRLFHIRDSDR